MIFKRHYDPEIMDDFSILDQRIDRALQELNIINYWLGGNSTSSKAINYILKQKNLDKSVRILDVGAGGSNLFNILNKRHSIIQWTSAELNFRACRFDKQRDINHNTVCCNAFELPFKDKSFEIIHASLFFHHFTHQDILKLIENFSRISSIGLVINDLRRNVFAYWGIRILTFLFSHSYMVKNDGPLSVKRGFVKNELVAILNQSGANKYVIKRRWAFRWMIVILL